MQASWERAKAFVKVDATCRMLAGAIVEANKARTPDVVAWAAFRDRVEEAGHSVPNVAYWAFLLIAAV